MDYELPVENLKTQASDFNSFSSSSSGKIDSQISALSSFPSGTLPIISTITNKLSSLKTGITNASNRQRDYESELETVESKLMEGTADISFIGSFENMFAKVTVPTLKTGATDRQIETKKMALKTVSGNENEALIYEYFASLGFNDAAICGILANIQRESNFRTDALGDGGTSYGICQWHNSRWTDLQNYCNSNGLDWHSLNGQLEFLNYELKNKYPSVYESLKNVPNTSQGAYDAAAVWTYKFEMPANTDYEASYRGQNSSTNYWNNYTVQNNTSYSANTTSNRSAQDELNLRYNALNRGSYYNDCPRVVNDALVGAGIISANDGEALYVKGKDLASSMYNTYVNNSNYNVSHYTIQDRNTAAQEFNDFVSTHGNENIVLSFSRGWGDIGAQMGHTMMVTRIENGKVYCLDNANVLDGAGGRIGERNGAYEYVVDYNAFLNSEYFNPNGQPILSDITTISKVN